MAFTPPEQEQINRIEGKIDKIKRGGSMFPSSKPSTDVPPSKEKLLEEEMARRDKIENDIVLELGGEMCPVVKSAVVARLSGNTELKQKGYSCAHNIGQICNKDKDVFDFAPEDCETYQKIFAD